jgi:hypothetical protein
LLAYSAASSSAIASASLDAPLSLIFINDDVRLLTNFFPKTYANSSAIRSSGISFSSSLSIRRAPKYSLGLKTSSYC